MKYLRIILPGLVFFISWPLIAQYEQYSQAYLLHMKLKDALNLAVPSFVICLTDKTNNKPLHILSDRAGKLDIPVEAGHAYVISDIDGNYLDEISIPKKPSAPVIKTLNVSRPAFFTEKPYDTVYQLSGNHSGVKNVQEAGIAIRVLDLDLLPQKDLIVRLVSHKYRLVYASTTDIRGTAYFQVMISGDYYLGIQDSGNMKTFKIPGTSGYSLTADVPYHPTNITEKTVHDTVYQDFNQQQRATFSRAFLEVTLKDFEHMPLPEEDVFLDVAGNSTVYTAKTDQQGKAYFLLPYGFDYTIHLTYERDIFPLNYPLKEGVLLENEAFITYRGTEQIRKFFKNARRDQHGFITEFMPVPVKKIGFDPANIEPTKHGFHVNFPAKSETPTPAILNNLDVIQGGGYYSREVFSLKSRTGLFNWGLELSDNGVSASVCDEDFLVITTESCTLYAIDAESGELAWSKWLGPEINSTPTIANGKIYVVYPTELDNFPAELENPEMSKKPYAIICFDLKTGNILWQNRVDSEPLGSPVACGNAVYLTTSHGNLHMFDQTSGKENYPVKNGRFTSPPTISEGIAYLTRRSGENPGQERIEAFQAASLKPAGSFPFTKNNSGKDLSDLSPSERMNYCNGRPLAFNGRLYWVSGKSLICFNPEKYTSAWDINLALSTGLEADEFSSMPLAVNQKIIASTQSGKVLVVDPDKGVIEKVYDLETSIKFQPVINDGWIYAGTTDGKLISYNTGNPALTGWPMWSLSAAHNPAID